MQNFHRTFSLSILLIMALLISGCADVFTIQTVAVSNDGQWVAYLASEEFAARFSLKLVNLSSGEVINVGEEGSQQGAFAWNPTAPEITYFNLGPDGVPSIQVSAVDNPSVSSSQFGPLAFPSSFWVNQMAYAPDGTKLALAVLLLPDGASMDANQPHTSAEVQSVLYIADLATGQVNIVSPSAIFATTAAWSPDGSKLAYTAWADDNQDGEVTTTFDPATGLQAGRDLVRVFIYDVLAGTTEPINSEHIHWSPTWLDANRLAVFDLPKESLGATASPSVAQYDLTSMQLTPLISASQNERYYALSASPTGTTLAISSVASTFDPLTAEVTLTPSTVTLLDLETSSLNPLYTADGTRGIVDAPAWSPDGQTLYISFANPPSAKITAFADYDSTGATPQGQLIAVPMTNPDAAQIVVEGAMASSGLMQFNIRN